LQIAQKLQIGGNDLLRQHDELGDLVKGGRSVRSRYDWMSSTKLSYVMTAATVITTPSS
jgi:hypothetical protein